MRKIEFEKSNTPEKVAKYLELSANELAQIKTMGSGVFKFVVSSGLLESIEKISDDNTYWQRSDEEILEDLKYEMGDDAKDIDWSKQQEFTGSEPVSWPDGGVGHTESWDEDGFTEYYWIVQ